MLVDLGNKKVGNASACFITFEAGPTHDGFESARHLVSLAAEAGADAVKFQIIDPDRLVADRTQLFTYDVLVDRGTNRYETVREPLYDILCRRALTKAEWRGVREHAASLGLAFFATVAFEDEVDLVQSFGCDSIKIASADVNHLPFLRLAARTGMCVQLDTGSASIGEIETAVDVIRREGNERIVIHHCPSGYPAHIESINLRVITTLKSLFPYPIAFSDHTPGRDMDIAALALGVDMLEKTITTDRMTRSVEHAMSLEPEEMSDFVRTIRDVEAAMGSTRRILQPEELEKRASIRRSIWLTQPVKKGEKLRDAQVEFRRPGFGIAPDTYEKLVDLYFSEDFPAGHQLKLSDLQEN